MSSEASLPNSALPFGSILLAGPTAAGKSEVALRVAEGVGGEIVSVDSMQVYRGLDIGTAKPSSEEQRRVRHHLIDVVGLDEAFDAARFVSLARVATREITERGRIPIFCGGTGLYFKALLEGLGEMPDADPKLRAELEASSIESLLLELERCDPTTYAQIDRQNPRRVIRAVEVIRLTGKPFSSQRAQWSSNNVLGASGILFVALTRELPDLHCRIQRRVQAMFDLGLVDETRNLLERGLEKNRNAMQAIGYRQVVEHLRGDRSLAETIALVTARTRQYAKRQLTWFRNQPGLEWISLESDASASATVESILEIRRAKTGTGPTSL